MHQSQAITVNQPITGLTANLNTNGTGGVATVGAGSVNTTNFNLSVGSGASTIKTNTTNLTIGAATSLITINQGTNAINVRGSASKGLTLTSAGQVTVNAPLVVQWFSQSYSQR